MKFLIASLVYLFSLTYAHAGALEIESIAFKEKVAHIELAEEISLPFVTSASQPKIAQKINDYLFIDLVRALAPAKASDGIKRFVIKEDDPMAGISRMEHKTLLNNGKVLTLQMSSEFCGAYCEDDETSYSFDAATGRHITLEDVIIAEKMTPLANKVYQARIVTLKKTIKALQKALATADHKKGKQNTSLMETTDDSEARILMYQTCLIEQANFHKEFTYHEELGDFTIGAKGITFAHARCSNHAMRALDDIDTFQNTYDYKTLAPYLTPYAKTLLTNDKVKFSPPTDALGQVLYGTVGTNKIIIKLDIPRDEHLQAVYFYQKPRQPITLSGSDTPEGIYWDEAQSKANPPPQISTKVQGDGLVGAWRAGIKVLPFKASPLP